MRMLLAITLGLGLTIPASADMDADFATANRIFAQASSAPVIAGLDGEWLPLATLANLRGEEAPAGLASSLLERICGNDPMRGVTFAVRDETSFTIEQPRQPPIVFRFDSLGGALFSRTVDPDALFAGLGLDKLEGDNAAEMRARALQQAKEDARVYRVSPDVIVVATSQVSEIYGRCPAAGQ